MKESDFVRIINNSIKAAGGFSYKIPDTPFIPNNPMRFTGKKPLDVISVINNKIYFIEAKFNRGINGFSEKILKPHQQENLLKIWTNKPGGYSYSLIAYCCYIPRQIKRIYLVSIWYLLNQKISKKMLISQLPFIEVKRTTYNKYIEKTKTYKMVKEDLFDASKMEEHIIK